MKVKPLAPGERHEIHNWESLISDTANFNQFEQAYAAVTADPVAFQYSLARTTDDLTGAVIPLHPYVYQEEYSLDSSQRKIVVKSRQVGFTTQEAFVKFWKGYVRKNYSCFFFHVREDNVTKYLNIIGDLNDNLPAPLRLEFTSDREIYKKASNGSAWRGMSLNAAESALGFTGDLVLDEFAQTPTSEKILTKASSVTVRGFELTIGSTPLGKGNAYHRIVKETSWDTSRIFGSVPEYRRVEAEGRKLLKEGYFEARDSAEARLAMNAWIDEKTQPIRKKDAADFYTELRRVQRNNVSDYAIHAAPFFLCGALKWSSIMSLGLTYEKLLQEYFLGFLDETTSMLPMTDINACISADLLLHNPAKSFEKSSRAVFLGIDPSSGQVNETAWIFVMEPLRDRGLMVEPWRVLWYETTWEKRLQYVPRLAKQIASFKPSMIYIDSTGFGASIAEDLASMGIGNYEAINMSNRGHYESMYHNLISIIQSHLLVMPDDPRLADQLFSLEKGFTKTGKAYFTGKVNSSDGQDDLVQALALALSPGGRPQSGCSAVMDIDIGDIEYSRDTGYTRNKDERYL